MKTLVYPAKDYDFQTYFKLEGFGDDAFSLLPDGLVIKADSPDYDADAVPHMDSQKPITDGEWVRIEDKEHVTVIDATKDPEYPVRFILATNMPYIDMDGAGNLTIGGTILEYEGIPVTDDDMEKPGGEFRLGRALRHAQLAGLIPDHCEYALDDSGSYHKIIKGI